jgi:hypothetical protein
MTEPSLEKKLHQEKDSPKSIVKARVWKGETDEYKMCYVAPYPMTEKEVRKRLKLPKNEILVPKPDRRMINNGLVWKVKGKIKKGDS